MEVVPDNCLGFRIGCFTSDVVVVLMVEELRRLPVSVLIRYALNDLIVEAGESYETTARLAFGDLLGRVMLNEQYDRFGIQGTWTGNSMIEFLMFYEQMPPIRPDPPRWSSSSDGGDSSDEGEVDDEPYRLIRAMDHPWAPSMDEMDGLRRRQDREAPGRRARSLDRVPPSGGRDARD